MEKIKFDPNFDKEKVEALLEEAKQKLKNIEVQIKETKEKIDTLEYSFKFGANRKRLALIEKLKELILKEHEYSNETIYLFYLIEYHERLRIVGERLGINIADYVNKYNHST